MHPQTTTDTGESRPFTFKDLEGAIKEEIFSPALLPYKKELINDFLAKINLYESILREEEKQPSQSPFRRDIYTLEVDRAKYYLKKYLRARLAKIERHILYIFQNDLARLMSKAEFSFAVGYFKMLTRQFNESFFKNVDTRYGEKLFMDNVLGNKTSMFAKMVDAPNENEFVFVRVLEPSQTVVVDRQSATASKNDILFIAYKYIKPKVLQNKSIII